MVLGAGAHLQAARPRGRHRREHLVHLGAVDRREVGRDLDPRPLRRDAERDDEHRADRGERRRARPRHRAPRLAELEPPDPLDDHQRAAAGDHRERDLQRAVEAHHRDQVVVAGLAEERADAEEHRERHRGDPPAAEPRRAREDRDHRQQRGQDRQASLIDQPAAGEPSPQPGEPGPDLVGDPVREAAEAVVVDDHRQPRHRRADQQEHAEHDDAGQRVEARLAVPPPPEHPPRRAGGERDAERDPGERVAEPDEQAPRDRRPEAAAVVDPARAVREGERQRDERPELGVEADHERAVGAVPPLRAPDREGDRDRGAERDPRRRAADPQRPVGRGGREHQGHEDAELEAGER